VGGELTINSSKHEMMTSKTGKNDRMSSKTGKNSLNDLKRPSEAIEEAIQTDTWCNIPVCLVRAFNASVENQ